MSKPKYTYAVEVQNEAGAWIPIVTNETRDFCLGYVVSHESQPGPSLAIRSVRSDGEVGQEERANLDVSIGMVAGFPTAEQYEDAGKRALDKGAWIRVQQALRKTRGQL